MLIRDTLCPQHIKSGSYISYEGATFRRSRGLDPFQNDFFAFRLVQCTNNLSESCKRFACWTFECDRCIANNEKPSNLAFTKVHFSMILVNVSTREIYLIKLLRWHNLITKGLQWNINQWIFCHNHKLQKLYIREVVHFFCQQGQGLMHTDRLIKLNYLANG